MAVNIGPRIGIDGEAEYRKQLQNIIQETKTLKSEFQQLESSGGNPFKKATEQAKLLNDAIVVQQEKIKELERGYKEAADKFGENDTKTLKWKQALNEANTELNTMKDRLKDIPNKVQIIGTEFKKVGDKIKTAGDKITNLGRSLTPVSTAATGMLAGSAKAAVDFETAMTGVMKTNDELVDENGKVIISYDDLADAIKKMSTETASSKTEIAGVMEAAGQLGVGTEYLTDFTKTMIMLGDSTNLSAEEAASALAKFANVTGMSLKDTDRLGAAIVELGNNYATTEQDIVNMATRLSGAGAQIGLSEGEILGFATALSSVGIEAEMGGSAFSKAMIKMQVAAETGFEPVAELSEKTGKSLRDLELMSTNDTKRFKELAQSLGMTTTELKATITAGNNLNDFAAVANMNTEEFVKLYRTDAPAALQAFISGLGDTEGHGESTIAMLQEMGFTEVRLRDTLTRLANANDLVTDAVKTGNEAWKDNTALVDEAQKKYDTTESKISQTKERVTNLAIDIGERLLPYVEKGLDFLDRLVTAWDGLSDSEKENIIQTTALVAAAAPLLTGVGKMISAVGTLIGAGGNVISLFGNLAPAASTAAGSMTAAGTGAAAAGTSIAAIAAPVAAAVAVLGVLAGAFVHLYNTNDDFKKQVNDTWKAIQERFEKVTAKIKPAWEAFSKALAPVFETALNSILHGFDNFATKFEGILDVFTGILTGDWKKAWSGIKEFFVGVVNSIVDKFKYGIDLIGNIIRKFKPEFPKIKLPHFKISGEFSLNPPSVPHISIEWYKKAMQNGMRLSGATIFGAKGNKLLGGGEAGNEWIIGEGSLYNMIKAAVQNGMGYAPEGMGNTITVGDTTINIYAAPGQDVEELADIIEDRMNNRYLSAKEVWA